MAPPPRAAQAWLRGWRLEVCPGVGHVPPLQEPGPFVELVAGRLRAPAVAAASART